MFGKKARNLENRYSLVEVCISLMLVNVSYFFIYITMRDNRNLYVLGKLIAE